MKKVLNLLLVCSILATSAISVSAKEKKETVKKQDKIEIVKPEKETSRKEKDGNKRTRKG